MSRLTIPLLTEIVSRLTSTYPFEGCGLVLETEATKVVVHPCRNLANELHAQDPQLFPSDARTCYTIDPGELLAAEQRCDRVLMVYHSHCDAPAAFSRQDRLAAEHIARSDRSREYLVVSVVDGIARQAVSYRFEPLTHRFEAFFTTEDVGRLCSGKDRPLDG